MKLESTVARILIALLLFSVPMVPGARADEPAVRISTSGPIGMGGGPVIFGWQFSPQFPIRVTSIGLFDTFNGSGIFQFGDGFHQSHRISLWDLSQPSTPLVSIVMGSGLAGTLDSGFRFIPIPELSLDQGRSYVIGAAYTSTDPALMDWVTGNNFQEGPSISIANGIDFMGYRWGSLEDGSSIRMPENLLPGDVAAFGPNFKFVPEPSTWALVILGTALFAAAGMRQRRP